ncbi:hypothetical protein NP493_89g04000 [Ridgeia piscesae]|uniref:Uncharacterized protein n=1 Tax=Ridgeia piscesae TaxID=27915 RepID=A0AAD9P893_RIDPI|nr:hypothetical protein NP493_89g04000 [Ridgeia piscesae]
MCFHHCLHDEIVDSSISATSSCSEDIDCGWNSVCDENRKLCHCLPDYTLSYNNIDCINTQCEDSDCLQCTNADVCQRCVDYVEVNTGRCLRKCPTDYHLFVEGDQLGKVCPERVPSRLDRVYLAVIIGIVAGTVLVVLVSVCLYWRINSDRKQKLRLKILEKVLERERLDGSQMSKSGSQDFGCTNAAYYEDIAPVRGPPPQSQLDYRPLVEKLTPHIDTFLMMLHEARVKQKQLLPGDPQLLVYKNIALQLERALLLLNSSDAPVPSDAAVLLEWADKIRRDFLREHVPTVTSSPTGTLTSTFKPDLRLVPNGDSPGRALQGNGYTYERCEQGLQGDREVGEITLIERDYTHPIDV